MDVEEYNKTIYRLVKNLPQVEGERKIYSFTKLKTGERARLLTFDKKETMKTLLAENLIRLRNNAGLTQDQLSNKIDIPRSRYGAYEEGRAEPSIKTMLKISEYFKVEIKSLVNDDFSQVFKDYMK